MVIRPAPRRRGILGALLLIALALVAWVASLGDGETGIVTAVVRAPTPASLLDVPTQRTTQPTATTLVLPEREPIAPGTAFGMKSWFVAPPKPPEPTSRPVAIQTPSRPGAPPLPYTFVGTITLGDGNEVLHFMRGMELRVARLGETLDDHYRLDDKDRNAIVFTYLPLSQRQYLALDKD